MSLAARRCLAAGAALAATGLLAGCLERRIHITSDPPDALVFLNDVEVGRTPCEIDFEFYGVYDVRLTREGCEPLLTSAEAKAPAHETPGIDLIALILPIKFTNDVRWHFSLAPAADDADGVIERGRELRGDLAPVEPAPEEPVGSAAPTP